MQILKQMANFRFQNIFSNMKRFLLFIGLTGLAYWVINNAHVVENPLDFNLQTKLIQADTADITRIVILPRNKEDIELVLNRTEAGWIATQEVKNILASPNMIEELLKDLKEAKVIGVKKLDEDFKKINQRRVQVFNNQVMVGDLITYVGRIHSEMSSGWATYLSFADGQEVYEIDGKIGFSLVRPFETYYNKTIVNILPSKFQRLILEQKDTSFSIQKSPNGYLLNDAIMVDSLETQQYFQTMVNAHNQLKNSDFVFDFDEIEAADQLLKTLNIYTSNQPEPVKISLFYDSTAVKPFVIHSSLNKDGYFASDSIGLYRTIFEPFLELMNPKN